MDSKSDNSSLQIRKKTNMSRNYSQNSIVSMRSTEINEKRLEFNELFKKLKNDLKITKKCRKLKFDSLLKRIKSRFFRCFQKCIKSCILDENLTKNIKTLPQKFITDIRIPTNKNILNMTLEEIYSVYNINLDILFPEKNLFKIDSNKFEIFLKLWRMPFFQAYDIYLDSIQYKRDLVILDNLEEKNFNELYKITSENFINYYRIKEGRIWKK